jgi:type II secretion system protein H
MAPSRTKRDTRQRGFTLIEILIVVVIVSILTVLGVQMVSSGSVERNLQQHGRILQASLQYSCDQATLQNIPYGIKFFQTGYAFTYFVNQEWIDLISQDTLFSKNLIDGSILSLELEGKELVLPEEEARTPQIFCDNTGQMTPFSLLISDASNSHHYQIKTVNIWNIEGRWLDDKKK